ncbi:fimbrillin family protein [Bacteroides fragilis]|uniref:fimbrillin family protein n=1 Tax=Bacteroides fragilis TaxID=817 RepID=UPI0022E5CFDC|nr:fimbrillin family protein [Bacteroides fragilis]
MKIKVYKHIVMFLLPAALTGCSGKEDSLPGTGEAGLEIENCFSRSTGTDTGHVPVKDFGMVLLDETGGSYTGVSNPLHVTYGDLSPQTDYLASDEVRLDWQNRLASIEMKHLLSLLAFTVDGSQACSLNVEAVPTEATYDLTGGILSVKQGNGTISSGTNMLLLLPGRLENRKAQVRYQDHSYDWYLPANTFEAGKRYDYALTLSKEGVLMLSGVSARPWETGGDYTGTIQP